jgi:aerobic-type carbon monoxide dehydrogenase small subunit (CoxS/CutS family)
MNIVLTINGTRRELMIDPGETLLHLLRRVGYKGVKKGCETGDCGACAVLLDDRAVNSCLVLAAKADGHNIITIEGLTQWGKENGTYPAGQAENDELHPIQRAFLDVGAVQCGYCTPGMMIAAADLLAHNPNPTEREIREAIAGNLCRCTGYVKQIEAISKAAEIIRGLHE